MGFSPSRLCRGRAKAHLTILSKLFLRMPLAAVGCDPASLSIMPWTPVVKELRDLTLGPNTAYGGKGRKEPSENKLMICYC